jgi:hypothetical protein
VAQINLIASKNKEFNVLFEGVIGSGASSTNSIKGDISIDDYSLKDRECEPLGSCDFEEDLCKKINTLQMLSVS